MENRSSENQENLNFADLMVGPEVEFRMYRAQIKSWVLDITTCGAREHVSSKLILRLQKTLKEQMVLYKNQKKENDEIQKKQDAVSNMSESYFMSHILWVMFYEYWIF